MATRLWPLLFLLCISTPAFSQEIDLQQAQRMALENNLNLQAQTFVTLAADARLRGTYGIYDLLLQSQATTGEVRQPSRFRQLDPAEEAIEELFRPTEVRFHRLDASLVQLLPTGASLSAFLENSRDSRGITGEGIIDPTYESRLGLSLVQPLLRDFGRTVNEQEILFAVQDRHLAVQDLRETAFQILTAVRNTYFDVLRTRDQLAFRRTSVGLAERVLEENRARVEAGVLAPVEILEAEVGLKLRERELIEAQNLHQDALDRLTLLLNAPSQVSVVDEPLRRPTITVSEEGGLQSALLKRPDILRNRQEIERLDLTERIARNRTRPALDLVGRYSHSGLGREYSDAFEDLFGNDYRSWEVGVTFSYPLGNTTARNELARTRILQSAQRSSLAQLHDEVRRDIRAAIRGLEVNSAVIDVTELGTRLARERLDTLLRRMEVGLATTRDVLEGEEDLAQARTLHIAALADYNQAVTEYLRATGLLLEHIGVRFVESFDQREPLLRMSAE
jgi:outer membrane protein